MARKPALQLLPPVTACPPSALKDRNNNGFNGTITSVKFNFKEALCTALP